MIVLLPKEMLKMEREVNRYLKWDGIRPYIPDDAPYEIKLKNQILIEYLEKAFADMSEM